MITYIEVYQGIYRQESVIADRVIEAMMAVTPVLSVTVPIARRCARLRETLRRQGRRVNTRAFDLIIAATAIEHDLTLVTRNTDDSRDIEGLRLYHG